jgi:hypothetical protein
MGTAMLNPEVFEKAADLIKERGHTKGVYVDSEGCVCTLGALGVTLGVKFVHKSFDPNPHPEHFSLDLMNYGEYLGEFFKDWEGRNGWSFVHVWNDDDDTTSEDAQRLLRECAEDIREENARWHSE